MGSALFFFFFFGIVVLDVVFTTALSKTNTPTLFASYELSVPAAI